MSLFHFKVFALSFSSPSYSLDETTVSKSLSANCYFLLYVSFVFASSLIFNYLYVLIGIISISSLIKSFNSSPTIFLLRDSFFIFSFPRLRQLRAYYCYQSFQLQLFGSSNFISVQDDESGCILALPHIYFPALSLLNDQLVRFPR